MKIAPTTRLTQGLDYYKPTMSQLEYEKYPDANVTFRLKNRSSEKLSDYVRPEELSERLEYHANGMQPDEIAYLASLQNQDGNAQFCKEYLDYIADSSLPEINIGYDSQGDISAETTGPWPLVTFCETVLMSELNELRSYNKLQTEGRSLASALNEGDRRLTEKINFLRQRPDIKIADFGTRRRFSYAWQKHVVERLADELPDNFVGTSNVYLANKLNLKPIGTMAHELPMGYASLADQAGQNPLSSHAQVLDDWQEIYRGDLSTALPDTFTTGFFFANLRPDQAEVWRGLRHDSGDPIRFGEQTINYYRSLGIDPRQKSITFSDGLDLETIAKLSDYFLGRINFNFGWGTTLTNDLGLSATSIVMKAEAVNGTQTVKLSDSLGKHTGPEEYVKRYQALAAESINNKSRELACV